MKFTFISHQFKNDAISGMMKKSILLLLFTILLIFNNILGFTQEPFNTEIRFSDIGRNPALAGIQVSDLKIGLCYHHQIKTLLLPYRSLQIQIESRFRRKETEDGFTAGALIRYDEAGINNLKRAQFLPALNFHKSLSDMMVSYLSLGFMTGIFKTQFDPFTLPSIKNYHPIPFDPINSVPQRVIGNSSSYFDFSTGISWYTELNHQVSLNLGAALFHFSQNILKQEVNSPKMTREWVMNSSVYFNNTNYTIQFLSDIRINKNESKMYYALIWGIPFYKDLLNQTSEIQLGSYYNSNKELSPIFSVKWPDFLISISYNFLLGNSKKIPILENSFETNLVLSINCHKKNSASEKMRCPF